MDAGELTVTNRRVAQVGEPTGYPHEGIPDHHIDEGTSHGPAFPVCFPQHPDEHRPQRPILLAVDQQLGEGTALG